MGRKRKRPASFVAIGRAMLKNPEWLSLSNSAKLLYIYLKAKYVGHNNGDIELHYSELTTIKLMSPATISEAFKELLERQWVEKKKVGGMYRFRNKYSLTGKFDDTLLKFNF